VHLRFTSHHVSQTPYGTSVDAKRTITTTMGAGAAKMHDCDVRLASATAIWSWRESLGNCSLMIYFPGYRLVYTSDLFAPDGSGGWFTPQYLREFIGAAEREHLTVQTIFGLHYDATPYQTVFNYATKFTSYR